MTKKKSAKKPREKPARKGPEPKRLKFDGNWENAVDIALRVKRPKDGLPGGGDGI